MYEDITVIISAISAVAAAIGLIFNGLANKEQAKSNYYQTLKDLDVQIQEIESRKDVGSEEYIRTYINFLEKIAFLFYNKIIPCETISYFDDSFKLALMYLEKDKDKDRMKKDAINFMRYCNEYNLKPVKSSKN